MAYLLGRAARREGLPFDTNSYPEDWSDDASDFCEWCMGWINLANYLYSMAHGRGPFSLTRPSNDEFWERLYGRSASTTCCGDD